MGEILEARAMNERDLTARHPWVPIFYNWLIAAILAALTLSLIGWGIQIAVKNRDFRLVTQAVADYQEAKDEEASQAAAQDEHANFLRSEVDAVLPVIGKLSTDRQKQTELGIMIARHMNGAYPGTFAEIAAQPAQWPLYDGTDKTYCEETDRPLAEEILLPYLESGAIPRGLTKDIVYANWSPTDLVGRNTWEFSSATETWRYQG